MAIDGTPSVDRASELKICEREVIARGGAALFGEGTPEQSRATSALQYLSPRPAGWARSIRRTRELRVKACRRSRDDAAAQDFIRARGLIALALACK
jgi:hypothetical protein